MQPGSAACQQQPSPASRQNRNDAARQLAKALLCPACLQEMEHRIARAGGHRSDDEARALNARIADLSKLLETVSSEHAMLTTQVSLSPVCDPDSVPAELLGVLL